VTLFGLFLTPLFYVVIRNAVLRREARRPSGADPKPQELTQ
jgi:gold/copper resistance efflux pump